MSRPKTSFLPLSVSHRPTVGHEAGSSGKDWKDGSDGLGLSAGSVGCYARQPIPAQTDTLPSLCPTLTPGCC